MSVQSSERTRPLWARIIVWLGTAFVLWHVFATTLWVFPYTPLREVVPGGGNKALTAYMIPMFGQSWSVFAPQPARSELRLSVRAQVEEGDGSITVTDWVDADRIELATTRYNLFPSYGAVTAEKLAHSFNSGYYYLDVNQQQMITEEYVDEGWLVELETDLIQTGQGGSISGYLTAEKQTTAYATQVAKAVWGAEAKVLKVQYLVMSHDVLPYEQRLHGEVMRPLPLERTTGWRAPLVLEGQDEEAFAHTFNRWREDYVQQDGEK